MKESYCLYFSLLLFLSGCNSDYFKNDLCLSNNLKNVIEEYIRSNEYKIALYDENDNRLFNIYFTVYFHSTESDNYFTILESPYPPNIIFREEIGNKNPPMLLLYTLNHNSVFIVCRESIPRYDLFQFCKEKIDAADSLQSEPYVIYDGSYFPSTYKYAKINDSVVINKLKSPMLEFNEGWKKYEENIKNSSSK